jgi:hypothetical protein
LAAQQGWTGAQDTAGQAASTLWVQPARSGQVSLLCARLLAGQSQAAQLWFDAAVLDKYRSVPGAKVLRTDTLGRLKLAQWSLDFGIVDAPGAADVAAPAPAAAGRPHGALIHLSLGEAQARIPEAERGHWSAHAVALPGSASYLTLQLSRGTCIDDGDLRSW